MTAEINHFDPTAFSRQENEFLLLHIGEPPSVALRDVRSAPLTVPHKKDKNPVYWPGGVNPAAVQPFLARIYELIDLQKNHDQKWVGIEAVKAAISIYLRENAKWRGDHQRTAGRAPRFPSMFSYDAKGRPHLGGPGSDSGRVRTYFSADGSRKPFLISLFPEINEEWAAPGFTEAPLEKGLRVDKDANRIECLIKVGEGICGHTESFRTDSRQSYNLARGRMSKHLRKAIENIEEHRELHTNEFGN